jgi:hypothetical protein
VSADPLAAIRGRLARVLAALAGSAEFSYSAEDMAVELDACLPDLSRLQAAREGWEESIRMCQQAATDQIAALTARAELADGACRTLERAVVHAEAERDTARRALGERWQPIESAPKMRTILLFAVTDIKDDGTAGNWKMATGSWHEGYEDERSKARGYTPWHWGDRQLKAYEVQPTHWMPLPAPPRDGTGGGAARCTCAKESAPAFCEIHGEPLYRKGTGGGAAREQELKHGD